MITPAGPPQAIACLAPRLGALAWVSGQLFEIEGRWAATMTDAAAVVHLATHSRHHGWHSRLWSDALPDSPALAASELVQPPADGWAAALAVAAAAADSPDVTRLALLYRGLVPRALGLLVDLDDVLTGPGAAHLQRLVGLVRPDVVDDALRGHRLLEATLGDERAVEAAVSAVKTLDQAFLS